MIIYLPNMQFWQDSSLVALFLHTTTLSAVVDNKFRPAHWYLCTRQAQKGVPDQVLIDKDAADDGASPDLNNSFAGHTRWVACFPRQ